MSHPASAYKKTAVLTANRGQILLMLYEAAIRHTKLAITYIEAKDIANKGKSIIKVHDIINELSNSLNHDIGGKISQDLERLYNFITTQLIKANIENSKEPLEGVLKVLENLYEGWKGAVAQVNSKSAQKGTTS
jgi:flagellar protein FliS